MAISYSWKVNQLTKKTEAGTDNVIVHCRWVLTGTESSTGTTGQFNGATPLAYDPENTGSFIPYENLTEENVVSWLKTIVVGSYWDHVTEVIAEQIGKVDDPVEDVLEDSLPWAPVTDSSEVSGSGE